MASRDRSRSPSVEILWSTVRPRARSPSVEILGVRNVNVAKQTGTGTSTSKAGAKKRKSSSAGEERIGPAKKRAKNSSTGAQDKTEKEKEKEEKEKEKPEERWKWINRTRPEIELKGTRIQAHNCGGTFFKASAKKVADRLDKLEAFLDECGGDETAHECYGRPELYKPKRVSKKNKNNDPEEERWTWIDQARPDIQLRGTKLEAYNCGGCYFRASGRTVAEKLDEMEAFLAECEGDETCHPSYGCF